jgi:hypothetical protein
MAAITWRNVTGASAGNPASALASASSAFGSASRGALDLVDSIRKGDSIKRANATEQAIAGILASGKPLDAQHLSEFEGVDISKVLASVQGSQINQSNLDSAEITRRLTGAQADAAEFANKPEQQDFVRRQAEAQTENVESQLRIRQAELNRLNARDAKEAKIADGILAIERGTYGEGPEDLRGQAIAFVEQNTEAAKRRLHERERENPRFRALPIGEQQDYINQLWDQNYDRFVDQEASRRAPEWYAKKQSEFGLTRSDVRETTLGNRLQTVEEENTRAISQENAASRAQAGKEREAAQKALEDGNLTSLIPSGSGYNLVKTAAERKENTLTESAALPFIENELDIKINSGQKDDAIDILRLVGNNKAKFAEIMNAALTDRDRGIIPWDKDDIDWAKATSLATQYRSEMRGELKELSKDPEAADPTNMTFQELLNQKQKSRPKADNATTAEEVITNIAASRATERQAPSAYTAARIK